MEQLNYFFCSPWPIRVNNLTTEERRNPYGPPPLMSERTSEIWSWLWSRKTSDERRNRIVTIAQFKYPYRGPVPLGLWTDKLSHR